MTYPSCNAISRTVWSLALALAPLDLCIALEGHRQRTANNALDPCWSAGASAEYWCETSASVARKRAALHRVRWMEVVVEVGRGEQRCSCRRS